MYQGAYSINPSPIKVHTLQAWLQGYPKVEYNPLIANLTHGIVIPSDLHSVYCDNIPPNHQSAIEHADRIDAYIQRELNLHRIAGPFHQRPPGLHVSPLAAVPKKDSGKIRIIHNLSYPMSCSVNMYIPREFCAVNYELLDRCVEIVAEIGQGCLIAKADLADAYRTLKMAQFDYRFLGFTWRDKYYFDKVLPQGLSTSCSEFEKFSTSLQWILMNKLDVKYVSHILDDFMFFGHPNTNTCNTALQAFLSLAASIDLPIKHEKTVTPSTAVELHGILVNSQTMILSIPPDKLTKAMNLLSTMYRAKTVQLVKLQSLAGLLNFFLRAIPAGRPFIRRLYDLMAGHTVPSKHINLTSEARKDLRVWMKFLSEFNGSKIIKKINWTTDFDWRFFSDASGQGYAAILGHKWIQGSFPPEWADMNIAVKELTPIYLAFRLWGPSLSNSKILFHIDNESIVHVLSKHTSKEKTIMLMVRFTILHALKYDITFSASHVPGRHNVVADLLSRFQTPRALQQAPFLDQDPTPVPQEWLPWCNSLLISL